MTERMPMSERLYQPQSGEREYLLGDWRLCVNTNSLQRGDIRVELEHRLVLLLVFFIEHQGEVLGKEQILKTIWQGKVVNEDSLAVAISHLRKALGDNSRAPHYIKTIPGIGYQFIAELASGRKDAQMIAAGPTNVDASENLPHSSSQVHAEAADEWGTVSATIKKSRRNIIVMWLVPAFILCAVAVYWLMIDKHPRAGSKSSEALTDNGAHNHFKQIAPQLASWNPSELKSAIQSLRQLLQQYPDFAPAYAAIADAKIKLLQEQLAIHDNCAEVLGLLNKSINLDPQQSTTLITRGNVLFWCARDYAAAEKDYQQAIQLNPANDVAPMQYAQLLLAQGKFAESLQQVEQSRELNPLTYSIPTVVWIYQMQKRDDLALKELERINSAEPGDRYFHISAQRVYARMGRDEESMQHWLWLMRDAGYGESDIQAAQHAFSQGGLIAVNRWLLQRKDTVDLGQYIPPLSWARYALAAGEMDVALDYLEQAFATRQSPLLWGNVDPAYDLVRTHPRFQAIMQQLQKPEF